MVADHCAAATSTYSRELDKNLNEANLARALGHYKDNRMCLKTEFISTNEGNLIGPKVATLSDKIC